MKKKSWGGFFWCAFFAPPLLPLWDGERLNSKRHLVSREVFVSEWFAMFGTPTSSRIYHSLGEIFFFNADEDKCNSHVGVEGGLAPPSTGRCVSRTKYYFTTIIAKNLKYTITQPVAFCFCKLGVDAVHDFMPQGLFLEP